MVKLIKTYFILGAQDLVIISSDYFFYVYIFDIFSPNILICKAINVQNNLNFFLNLASN